MKRLFVIIAILAATSIYASSTVSVDTIDGFRGIKWGHNISSDKRFSLRQQIGELKTECEFVRSGDNLFFEEIEFSDIIYSVDYENPKVGMDSVRLEFSEKTESLAKLKYELIKANIMATYGKGEETKQVRRDKIPSENIEITTESVIYETAWNGIDVDVRDRCFIRNVTPRRLNMSGFDGELLFFKKGKKK